MYEKRDHQGNCYRLIQDTPDQPILVLIHGVGLNQNLWTPWIPFLRNQFTILTYDLLGHGDSHNPTGDRSARDFVQQLNELLDHLKIDQIALAGFSLGALISQAYAALNQNRLTHLVFLHSVYQRTDAQCASVRERYEITKNQGAMATVELAIERWFSLEFSKANPHEMDQLRTTFSKHIDDGYLKAYYMFANAEPEMENYALTGVDCPALVITGEDDIGSIPAMSRALAKDIPNSKLIINPGHRHGAPTEFTEVMANQVLLFLLNH